jgi:transcriptional regulator with XRE-family HTH domain
MRQHRIALGLSETALGERAHIAQARVSQLELGDRQPTTDERDRIAAALGADSLDLHFPGRRVQPHRRRLAGEARRAQAERAGNLYLGSDEPSMEAVGRKLGISERHVQRYVRELGIQPRPARRRAKYPAPKPRPCKNPRCDVVFTPSRPYHDAHGRGKYCSKACFDDTQRVYPKPDERECRLEGCTNRFRPGPWYAARGFGLFCCEDHYHQSEHKAELARRRMLDLHADPVWQSTWAWKLHGSTRVAGRRAKELAAAKGKRVGKPREKLTDEKVERILKLTAQKWSQQKIAYTTGVSRSTVRYVQSRGKSGLEPPLEMG